MTDENIKLLIKNEYENGSSMSVLSKKYNVKVNTIKSWSSKEKWIKKKQNTATKKRKTTKKKQPIKMVVENKQIQIKSGILNGATEKEIVEKYGVSSTTYYKYKSSIRNIQIERSEKLLQEVAENKYENAEKRLKKIADEKEKLENKILDSNDEVEIKMLLNKLKALREFEKEIKIGARIISDYRIAELEQQLVNEEILKEKIEIEKMKNNEIETVDLTIVEDYK